MKIEYVNASELKTYPNNAKRHPAEQIEQIKKSIEEFGMNDPIAIWKDNTIIEGHGRFIACQELGIDLIPVVRLNQLTDVQRKAYALVHNQLTMNTGFDEFLLRSEVENIFSIDMEGFGISFSDTDPLSFYEESNVHEGRKVVCPKCGKEFYIGKNGEVIE